MTASLSVQPQPSLTHEPKSSRPRRTARTKRSRIPRTATIVAWAYAVISCYPLIWLLLQSFRSDAEILGNPWGLIPDNAFVGYARAFSTTPLPQYFLNSLLVTACVVVLSVACCAGAGYAFSRLRFFGSNTVFALFIGVLVVPAPVLLLPVFLISKDLGILNSYVGLIGPYVAGTLPIGTYLMKTHFDALPDSYVEAAQIDRATPWQTFRMVMLPLIRPAAATVAVLAFMAAWNEYIYALVAIQSPELFTLPIGVADLSAKRFLYGYSPVFAAMVLTAVPVYLAFIFAQRSFTASIAFTGGVKG